MYGVPTIIGLSGSIDLELTARCMSEIIRRHESLRSRIIKFEDTLVSVTDPPQEIDVTEFDLRSHPSDAQEVIASIAREPFDLSKDRVVRVYVLHLSDESHLMLINIHHIAIDGWSLRVLWSEFVELYSAWWNGKHPDLHDLPAQYSDFAAGQRNDADRHAFDAQLNFWTREVVDAPISLTLPIARQRTNERSYRGASLHVKFSSSLRSGVLLYARRQKVTPFAVMLSAWAATLARYTHEDDMLIGSPLACRTRPEFDDLIGLFANTMPLRIHPNPGKRFTDLVHEVFLTTLDSLANQDVPFVKLIEEVRPSRKSRQAPLFQTVFSYDQPSHFEADLPGCVVTSMREACTGASRFDLSVDAIDIFGELSLRVEYDLQLFDSDTITNLVHNFNSVLTDALERPWVNINLLHTSHTSFPQPGGQPQYPPAEETLHGVFEDQARLAPDAPAVECEDGSTISYAELNKRANQLARHLQSLGISTGGRVAIALRRGSQWSIAVLAVLKAGCAYVPVDPKAPRERIARVIAQADPQLVLVEEEGCEVVGSHVSKLSLNDPDLLSAIGCYSTSNVPSGPIRVHTAYIPFTSGSTGQPKGALVSHTNLLSFTRAAVGAYAITSQDRFLQIAEMTFDVHVEEIFPIWASGGTVVFFDGDISRTVPADLITILREREITLCEFPTAYWIELSKMLGSGTIRKARHLRRVLIGGERAPVEVYRLWQGSGVPLTNVYGLTETSVTSTIYTPGPDPDCEYLPIGRPMSHASVYLLDDSFAPVGTGIPGEIYIGGPGVCDGFLNLPEMTADRFLPDPFATHPGSRMYRTGDIGRLDTHGDLEFSGRVDNQIKIRGHRVEPAEIESELERHPNVLRAVVVPTTGADGELKLVAYVVGSDIDELGVLRFIRKNVPSHLVPGRVAVVEKLPMTSHGKVDRQALLAITLPGRQRPAEAEMTPLQGRLSEIYLDELEIQSIGINDDIFELGGHSLLALRIIARLQDEFVFEVPIAEFINNSSISAVAILIAAAHSDGKHSDLAAGLNNQGRY
jgi:amino acid adenylation domain-containing protein